MSTSPLLTIMLPVRNGAEDLPAYLESVGRYADAVVALDDGSTDDTRAILAAHPSVKVLLENPRRSSYTGWNDAANRNALLDAAGQLDPQWLLSLDADERIDEGDGAALRAFLETDALPGLAYYLRCYPTETEDGRYSPVYVWVPRLFAYEPGQRLPTRRLHFAPIPVSIPRAAHMYTTFRIQHLGGMTSWRRQARYEKYRQADPDSHYWPDYTVLLDETPAEQLQIWERRDPATSPLYLDTVQDDPTEEHSLTVIAAPEHRGLAVDSPDYELIVSADPDAVLDRRLVEGASGTIVLALPPDVVPDQAALSTIVQEHAGGNGMVAPAIDAATGSSWSARWSRWRSAATRAAPELSVLDVRPTWCSYRRALLLEALASDNPPATVAALNTRLHLADYPCLQSSVRFAPDPSGRSRFGLLRAAFDRGRSDAGGLVEAHRLSGRLVQRRGRRGSMTRTAPPPPAEPLPAPLAAAHRLGAVVELARPRRGALALALGRPQLAMLMILSDGERRHFLVVSWTAAKRSVRTLVVPPWARIERPDGSVATLDEALPRTGRIPRFVLHEHVSRPFSIQVDEVVRVRSPGSLESLATEEIYGLAVAAGLRGLLSLESTVDRLSLGIFLLSARRADVRTLDPWTSRESPTLDAATASEIEAFFAGHLEVDRRNLRERLRLVKWG